MIIWGIVLFSLGVIATLDSQFNYGYVLRVYNSTLIMLLSLGVLIRARILKQKGEKEKLRETNQQLEAKVQELESQIANLKPKEVKQEVPA